MACKTPTSLTILLLFLSIASLLITTKADDDSAALGNIAVYWGQGGDSEGSLREACKSGNYDIIILQQLIVYDDGRTPELNLGRHCSDCTNLEKQIKYCQSKDIKILLQIGQVQKTQNAVAANSEDAAKKLAKYLLKNFLSGQSGPLGEVSLDGIDMASVPEGNNLKFDQLVEALNGSSETKIYLSASPFCVYPDYYLNNAIQTEKLDFIFVQFFYQNPCIYTDGDAENLFKAYKTWTKNVPESLIFLVVPASPDLEGYIEPRVLNKEIIPVVSEASNYGGIGIFDRHFDKIRQYSSKIKGRSNLRMPYRYRTSF